MAEVKWIKIITGIFDDEKILLIETLPDADSIIVIWFKLLCLAGKSNNGGVLTMSDRIHYTDEMLAAVFRRPVNTVRLAIQTFEQFGMVEIIDGAITIPNWEKHQQVDQLDKIKEQTRIRVAAHREKQKKLACNVTVQESNATDNTLISNSLSISKEDKGDCKGEKKQQRGEYGWVKLTDAEYQRLISEFGEFVAEHYIAYVDESAQSTGNKNKWKDFNLVVRKAIKNQWGGAPKGGTDAKIQRTGTIHPAPQSGAGQNKPVYGDVL